MKLAKRTFAMVLAIAGLFSAFAAMGAYQAYSAFNLTQKWSECSGSGTFNIDVTWTPLPNSRTFRISSGNACQFNGSVCGIRGLGSCEKYTCPGTGPCSARLSGCQQGRGGSWMQVSDWNNPYYQRIAIAGPRPCQ